MYCSEALSRKYMVLRLRHCLCRQWMLLYLVVAPHANRARNLVCSSARHLFTFFSSAGWSQQREVFFSVSNRAFYFFFFACSPGNR